MSRNSVVTILIALVVLVAGITFALSYAHPIQTPTSSTLSPTSDGAQTYTNATYGYSVSYPSTYESHEFQPEFAVIGTNVNESLQPQAALAVLHADAGDPLPTYEDFVRLATELACENTTSTASIRCTGVASSESFTSSSGASGEKLFLNQTTRTSAGNVSTQKRGPYYVFNISLHVSGSKYALLMVLPPPTLSGADINAGLLTSIANSIQMTSPQTK